MDLGRRSSRTGADRRLLTRAERETIGAAAAYATTYEIARSGGRPDSSSAGRSPSPFVDQSDPTPEDRAGSSAEPPFADHTGSTPEDRFVDLLRGARRSICHRLVRGLLRGRPEGLPPHVLLSIAEPSLPDDACRVLHTVGADELLDRLRPLPRQCRSVAYLPFPASDAVLAVPVRTVHGYERFRFAGPVSLLAPDGNTSRPHPVDVVPFLEREGAFSDPAQAERIADELAESVANLALARFASRFPGRRAETDRVPTSTSSTESPLEAIPNAAGVDPAAAIERLAIEGHPFHPGAKIRRGMTPSDALAYAPEFTDRIDVRFAAVENSHSLRTQTADSLTTILFDRFDGLEGAVERALPAGRSLEEYAVVALHPWQYHHVVPDRYAREIRRGRVVPVADFSWPATPLSNLRTVVPYPAEPEGDPLPHLKLAVDVQLTNVVRTVSPQAVFNGPRVTTLLGEIQAREAFESLGFLDELSATCYHEPGGPHPDGEAYDDARNLSCLSRTNPYSHRTVTDDGVPIAVSSLFAPSPVTDRPLLCDVVDRYTSSSQDASKRATATPPSAADASETMGFFEAYVDAVVPAQLRLVSSYGVALESHPQNTYVVFEDGHPTLTLVRDFGGIRVLDERLARHDLALEAYPDSDLVADGPRALYDKLYYALFQNHLAEVVATLSHHTPVAEAECWAVVRRRCRETFEAIRSERAVPARWVDRDEAALFEQPTVHKALTAMRLRGKRHEYVTSRVSNPLAPSDE